MEGEQGPKIDRVSEEELNNLEMVGGIFFRRQRSGMAEVLTPVEVDEHFLDPRWQSEAIDTGVTPSSNGDTI